MIWILVFLVFQSHDEQSTCDGNCCYKMKFQAHFSDGRGLVILVDGNCHIPFKFPCYAITYYINQYLDRNSKLKFHVTHLFRSIYFAGLLQTLRWLDCISFRVTSVVHVIGSCYGLQLCCSSPPATLLIWAKKIRPFHRGSTVLIHSTGFHHSSLRISSPHVFSSKINSILGRSDRPNKPFNINCDISILIYELAVSRLYDTCNMTVTAKLNCPLLLYNQSIHNHSFINSMLILSQQIMTANKAAASPCCNMRTSIFHDYTMDNVS